MGYEGQNFVKTDVNQCYILILLVCLQKFELFGPGLEYSPHTVVLNQAMDFFQACISFRYLVVPEEIPCNVGTYMYLQFRGFTKFAIKVL